MLALDPDPPHVGSSREEGVGSNQSSPASSGRTASLSRFADAVYDLCDTTTFIGCLSHYQDNLSTQLRCDLSRELNDRIAALLEAVGEDPCRKDVDVVFEAAHEAVRKALPAMLQDYSATDSSSGSR